MLNIFLCDDSTEVQSCYKDKLTIIKNTYQIPMVIHTFSSGKEMLFHMEEFHLYPDIIYLDILMVNENGIDVAKKLRDNKCKALIIFLTANPEYVFESFEAMPSYYIVKGTVSDARFEDIFLKCAIQADQRSKITFTCTNKMEQIHIAFPDIQFFEVENRVITMHYVNGTFRFYSKLDTIEEQVKLHCFARVHRSFLVNMSYIEEVKKNEIVLTNKQHIPLGITYAKEVKRKLNQYYNYTM